MWLFYSAKKGAEKMNEKYMKRAIELALKGRGYVNPNPLVGAVIVKNNKIIGEGWHKKYGCLHAERDAFKNLTENAEGADMYVTLEPCCHYGKQPPCTEAIVEHNIKRVFVGSSDPNPLVAGKGIKYLREHGIEVIENVLKEECDEINKVFFHYIITKTPYVVMKYAMTADGKIACTSGKSKWITGEKARENVQQTRKALSAIMVGIGTVITDNPLLTCRIEEGVNPIRIICDSSLKIPLESNIVKTATGVKTIIAYCNENIEKKAELEKAGCKLLKTNSLNGKVDLKELMKALGEIKIDSVLVEGGGELNYSILQNGIVNKLQVYIAPKIFGGKNAKSPVGGEGVLEPDGAFKFCKPKVKFIDNDLLLEFEKEES